MGDLEDQPVPDTRPAPALPSLAATAPELKLPGMSKDVRSWTSDTLKARSSNLEYENWYTKNLSSRLGVDVVAACTAGTLIAPIITVIDKAIIENASNQNTLFGSAKDSLRTLLLRPHHFLASKPFRLIFALYGTTYISANTIDTYTSTTKRPPAGSNQEHYSASHVSAGTAKFATTSATNLTMSLYKDRQFIKLFGAQSTRPVPGVTLGLYLIRDMMTIFASFNVPPLLAPHLPISENVQKYVSQASAAQFIAPATVQIFSTPLHLLGLDLYNRPGVAAADRLNRVLRDWGTSGIARMCRIIPAFGVGGVVNAKVRKHLMDKLE